MLTIRPFRNEDPPRLLMLWKKSQVHKNRSDLIPLSMNSLQMQVLGQPFFDSDAIMLAFDGDRAIGFVHTTLCPNKDRSDFSSDSGQICFLAIDPEYPDLWGAARILLRTAEDYLIGLGVGEIFGGSPRPCAPFYMGFYGGGEPLSILESDSHLIQVFQEAGYVVQKKTRRYRLNLRNYIPPITPITVGWRSQLEITFNDLAKSKNWWEGCCFANFEWHEAVAYQLNTRRPIARIWIRVANPDTEKDTILYGGTWDAGLMDIRVHPDFHRKGVAAYTLGEMLRYIKLQSHVLQIEAQIDQADDSLNALLRSLQWQEIETGILFRKEILEVADISSKF